ncbi:MAG: methylenetetrahydrofolate reductase C-terminal domain-containing protein [Pseudonocardia sp.]|nr:methylenetetrahydrofolate reductase C-terminal domain-containing protein [Pseudonocardia sp.]
MDPGGACPKHMVNGPCGGVRSDGGCEVGPLPCPWVTAAPVAWSGPVDPRLRIPAPLARGGAVIADVPAPPMDREALRHIASLLAGSVDAGLTGDHGGARVQFPPAYRALLLRDAGLAPCVGLNCRDRNRVALEGELAALADVGVAAVHCVTGDHTALGDRPDAAPVFDLDSTRLAALARATGVPVSVAEAPAGPPRERRPARLVEKVRAGADVAVVDHCGGAGPVADFVAETRELLRAAGLPDVPFVACLPVVLDRRSAELISAFSGFAAPPGYLQDIVDARDPAAAGVAAAVSLGSALLHLPGVRGVDLSGVPVPGEELTTARALATIGRELGGGT